MVRRLFILWALLVVGGPAWANCAAGDHSCSAPTNRPEANDPWSKTWNDIHKTHAMQQAVKLEMENDRTIARLATRFNILTGKEGSFEKGVQDLFEEDVDRLDRGVRLPILSRALEKAPKLSIGQRQQVLDLYSQHQQKLGGSLPLVQMAGTGNSGVLDSTLRRFSGSEPEQKAPTRGFLRSFSGR